MDGVPFADFCKHAFEKKNADALTLRFMEAMLGVHGCEGLEKHLPELTSFSDYGDQGRVYDAVSKESKQEVSSLKALAYAKRLRALELPYKTPVSDLTPLAHLKELVRILADASNVSDLSPLSGLDNLEELGVRTSRVKDITPLLGLARLRDLDVRNLNLPKDQVQRFKAGHPAARVLDERNR